MKRSKSASPLSKFPLLRRIHLGTALPIGRLETSDAADEARYEFVQGILYICRYSVVSYKVDGSIYRLLTHHDAQSYQPLLLVS